jgi:signal peptidase II
MDRSSASPAAAPIRRGVVGAQLRLFATALVIVVSDRIVKGLVVRTMRMGESVDVWGSFFRLTRTENTGAAFGMFRGRGTWFIVISLAAAIAIIAFRREIARMKRWEQLAFGLVLGGAVGNLIDRVRSGAVVDFLDFGFGELRWPAFNIADSAITVGVILLAVNLVFFSRPVLDGGGAPDPRLDAPSDRDSS